MEVRKNDLNCSCQECSTYPSFIMPEEIIFKAQEKQLVLFCGAGISTESHKVFPSTLYDEVLEYLQKDYAYKANNPSFSILMSEFCKTVPSGREELIRIIEDRFERISLFQELYDSATIFHREVAKIDNLATVITSNWDDYFETECHMKPILDGFENIEIENQDSSKKVYKIHGSVNIPDSIIASQDDYKNCYKRLSTENYGKEIQKLFKENCVVFIGFSFGDEDLDKLLEVFGLKMEHNEGTDSKYYIVNIDQSMLKYQSKNIESIITDGYFFIHSLRKIMESRGYIAEEKQTLVEEISNQLLSLKNIDLNDITSCAHIEGMISVYENYEVRSSDLDYKIKHAGARYEEMQENNSYDRYYQLGILDGLLNLKTLLENKNKSLIPPYIYDDMYFESIENLEMSKNSKNQL
ncbi:hypothetical protein BG261_08870 [Floricoccus tropicus]|uniref:Uncharacterized protein n=1 Tax=Floricoccus tropicus TaxID=1859473 RepID=A0A1E8GRG4_9LACT|nr:SIR2 family protein [Floricoccus tropicus]OFI50223.1 hypothetical protein BG261_08870 [Floricoccus tropicus]